MNDTDNIILIGLISGATVMGQTMNDAETRNSIHLFNPVQLVQMADEKTDRMVQAMVPFAHFVDKGEIFVSATAIEYIGVPKPKLVEEYLSMLSPIITPQKSIISVA